jgi:hypothetical protein
MHSDLDLLAEDMRPMDALECRLVAGLSPRDALSQCCERSARSTVAEIGGRIVCAFGVSEAFLIDEGYPWLLCANGIERYARAMLSHAPVFVEGMRSDYQRLSNVVHAHNKSAIRFLRWLGFVFTDEMTVKGEPFMAFEWRAQAQAVA